MTETPFQQNCQSCHESRLRHGNTSPSRQSIIPLRSPAKVPEIMAANSLFFHIGVSAKSRGFAARYVYTSITDAQMQEEFTLRRLDIQSAGICTARTGEVQGRLQYSLEQLLMTTNKQKPAVFKRSMKSSLDCSPCMQATDSMLMPDQFRS